MQETLISFETAKLAKEKGFDEPCAYYSILDFQNFKADGKIYQARLGDGSYGDNVLQFVKRTNQPHLAGASTQSLLQKWLREVHKIHVLLVFKPNQKYDYEIDTIEDYYTFHDPQLTYEEALEKGLFEALKLI